MQTKHMPSQNEFIKEVSSKSDNGKGFKNRGKILGGRGEISRKKMRKPHKFHPKISLCRKFHQNRTIGKGSKIEGRLGNVTDRVMWRTRATAENS